MPWNIWSQDHSINTSDCLQWRILSFHKGLGVMFTNVPFLLQPTPLISVFSIRELSGTHIQVVAGDCREKGRHMENYLPSPVLCADGASSETITLGTAFPNFGQVYSQGYLAGLIGILEKKLNNDKKGRSALEYTV